MELPEFYWMEYAEGEVIESRGEFPAQWRAKKMDLSARSNTILPFEYLFAVSDGAAELSQVRLELKMDNGEVEVCRGSITWIPAPPQETYEEMWKEEGPDLHE